MAESLLAELRTRLLAFGSNPVPLDGTTLGEPGLAIVEMLEAELGTSALTLAGPADVELEPSGELLRVTGALEDQAVVGISNPGVKATFTTDQGESGKSVLLLELEIEPRGGWALAESFPQLAQLKELEGLKLDPAVAPRFVLRSRPGDEDSYGPRQLAGLNLRLGAVAGSGPLQSLTSVLAFKAGAVLDLAGPAKVGGERESLALRGAAEAPEPTLGIGEIPVTLGAPQASISAAAAPPTSLAEATTVVEAEAIGMVSIGGGVETPLGLAAPIGGGPWSLGLLRGHEVALSGVLGFVSTVPLLDAIPAELSGAASSYVDRWSMTLTGEPKSWTLGAIEVELDVRDSWDVIPGLVQLGGIRLALNAPIGSGASVTGWAKGELKFSGGPAVSVVLPLPISSGDLLISSTQLFKFEGIGEVAELIGGVDLASQLPESAKKIGEFTLASLSAAISLSELKVKNVSLTLKAECWPMLPGRFELSELEIDLSISEPFTRPALGGSFGGTLLIAEEGISVLVQRASPGEGWQLEVEFEPLRLPTIEELAGVAGVSGSELAKVLPKPIAQAELELAELDLAADLSKPAMETFALQVRNVQPWQVTDKFLIAEADIAVALDWRSGPLVTTGQLLAVLEFGKDAGKVVLGLEADLEADGSWLLSGELKEPVELGELVKTALGFEAPDGLLDVTITPLSLSYDTGSESFHFAGGASWQPQLPGVELEVDAAVKLGREPVAGEKGKFAYSGLIEGALKSHFGSDTLDLSVGYEFQEPPDGKSPKTQSYVFSLAFNELTLSGSYVKAANGDGIVTLKLGGVTFGEIVGYLVHLVDPSLPSTLSPPWDVLDKIHFEDLELIVNMTQRTIGISDKIDLDLGIVDVEIITLTYVSKGGSPTVEIAIAGSFLGQEYKPEEPLAWDMLNEQPPATPGAGAALLDLKDLGFGQHLALAPGAKTVPAVIERLHEVVAGTEKNPKPWEILHFDPQAGWLIGANLTVMGTVTLEVVFNDPVLYGAQISLSGPKAGPFDGLVFQILYRKVSADVGVYHVELQLPTAMRHLEFGAVSLTLPSMVLDVYTDGGFYVDLGFPYENDWSVAFGLQIFPFVGAGGFYVGRLTAADGATEIVPQISNGTFGPVVEFGVALALGVGKEISEGPLSAGVSVTTKGILTGVIAWFNPADASRPSDRYYRIDGSLAIVGKLYGSVDFKVISVSVSITASVTASVAIEAYAPIYLGLSVDVRVEASIKILFVRIYFHFSMHMDASFTIGSQQATPWTLGAPASPAPTSLALTARRRMEGAHHLLAAAASSRALGAEPERLRWQASQALPGKAVVEVTLLPVITVAPGPTSSQDEATIAMTPSMPATPPRAGAPTPLDEVKLEAFDVLVKALLNWGIGALVGATPEFVSAVDLELVYEDLTAPDVSQRGFDYQALRQFLEQNLIFALVPPDPAPAENEELHSSVLPMPPPLKMTPEGQPAVDFSALPEVDEPYQRAVQEVLEELAVDYAYDKAPGPAAGEQPQGAPRTMVREGGEPIGEALFADWLLGVARSSFQAAINELKATSYDTAQPGESLAGIAAEIAPTVEYKVRSGDTAASIAHLFGISAPELLAANGGTIEGKPVLQVPPPMGVAQYFTLSGDTLTSIAGAWGAEAAAIRAANPGVDFTQPGTPVRIPVPAALFDLVAANLGTPLAEKALPLAELQYAVRDGDTFASIATTFEQGDEGAAIAEAAAGLRGLLLPGAELNVPGPGGMKNPKYKIAVGDTLPLIAAYLEVRNGFQPMPPQTEWFVGAVAAANAGADAGGPWEIPVVERTESGLLKQVGTVSYQPRAGDTFQLAGGYFTLAQLYPETLSAAIGKIETVNGISSGKMPPAGTSIELPVEKHKVAPGETLSGIAESFGLAVSELAKANVREPILNPNAELTLPADLEYRVKAETTLQQLASEVGLTVDALVGRIGALKDVFAGGAAVKRPNARRANVEELLTRIVGNGETANVAGMSSHFMLHGLRLPKPPEPKAEVEALYRITRQQFPAPASIATTYKIGFEPSGSPTWARPAVVHTTAKEETLAEIAALYGVTEAEITELNPGIDPEKLPAKVLVPQRSVDVTLDQKTLVEQAPATTLNPQLEGNPERQVLFHAAPVTHSVGPRVPWTAPNPPQLPGTAPAGGGPSLWRLPPSLLGQIAAGRAASGPYLLGQSPKGQQVPDPPPEVASWSWVSMLSLTVRKMASPAGGWLDGTYLLIGAQQADRDRLLALWTHLQASQEQVQLFLAYPSAAGGGGLVSDTFASPSRVAIIRSNLSTETHSGPAGRTALEGPPPSSSAYATLGAPAQFLQMAWEASVTGTGGFYLSYANAAGAGLPASAFPAGEEGQIQVIAVVADPGRELHPYTTAALVADNLDPGKVDVFAYAVDGETTAVPTAPPGNVAFELTRKQPPEELEPKPEVRTESLFSLLGFTVTGNDVEQPRLALPVGPKKKEEGEELWHYERTIPVYKLLTAVPPDLAEALPAGAEDPYAAVARQAGASGSFQGASVQLGFSFRDVYGNELASPPSIPAVSAPVGYYDPVLGLSAWPGASGHYEISGPSGKAAFTARLDLGLDKYVPSPSNPFPAAVCAAAADRLSYRQIHYQLQQADVTCAVDASLAPPQSGPLLTGRSVKRPMEAFAMASYLYLGAAQAVQQVEHEATAGETLARVAEAYVLTPAELANANAAADLVQLVGGPVTIPHDRVARSSDTLGAIAAAGGIGVEELLERNLTTRLQPATALPTATATFTTRGADQAARRPADTFATVAAFCGTSVAALATANAANPGILEETEVKLGSVTVEVGKNATLEDLVAAFATQGVKTTAIAIANAYASLPLLATGVPIAIANVPAEPGDETGVRTHVVAAGEALGPIAGAERCTLFGLAVANAQLPNLLQVDAAVEVKGVTARVEGDCSLAGTVEQLLTAAIKAGREVAIGLGDLVTAIETESTVLVPGARLAITDYVVQPDDTVKSLEALPWFSRERLARLAAPAPTGVYSPGTSLRISTTSYTPQDGDSFLGVAAQFGLGVEELAEANGSLAFKAGAQAAIPGAVRLGSNQGAGLYVPLAASPTPTLADVIAALATDGEALGSANEAMPGLLAPEVTVSYQGKQTETGAGSTLASVAAAVGAKAADLVADPEVAALPGLVAPGAFFVSTAPAVKGRSLDEIATALGVPPAALAAANGAVLGLLTVGRKIVVKKQEGENEVTTEATTEATDTLASLVRKLAAQSPSIELGDLLEAYGGDPDLLDGEARLLVPPPEISMGAELAQPYVSAPLAPLEASLTIARDPSLIDPAATAIHSVAADTTPLTPNLGPDGRPDLFARAFEVAYSDRRFKLATGPQGSEGVRRLWVVDFGAPGFAKVQVQSGAARFYALEPVSRELLGGAVEVREYQPKSGTFGTPITKQFAAVDLDAWMRIALEAIDLFLSAAVAARTQELAPEAFTKIVEGKKAIAEALSLRVQEVLVDSEPAGLEEAQQALRQSLLVSLATAYTTDAVVQFPLTVESPFKESPGTTPPRLAGKPVVAKYRVPDAGSVESLVALLEVSRDFLAGALAAVGGILTPKTTVAGSYEVQEVDTLDTVATGLGTKPSALLAGIEAGTVTVSGGSFFRAGAAIPFGRIVRKPGGTDSFGTLAEYFNVSPADLAVANQDAPRTLSSGIEFEHEGRTYTTTGQETIAFTAQQLGYGEVGEFALDPDIVARAGVFNVETALHGLQAIPDLSLSTLKVPLAGGTQFASFLLSTSADARHRGLFLDLDLAVDEIEFHIEEVPGAPDYQSSDWLRFPLPLEHEALEGAVKLDALQVDVPIALRSYPRLPLVRALEATPTWKAAPTIEEAKQWQLEAWVDYDLSAQDEVRLKVSFGAPGEVFPQGGSGDEELFQPLAQFAMAWPQMQNDVAALSALAPGSKQSRLEHMAGTFEQMVQGLVRGLQGEKEKPFGQEAEETFEFRVEATYDPTDTWLESLDLSLVAGPEENPPWPAIFRLLDGEGEEELKAKKVGEGSRRYEYEPRKVESFEPITHRFVFPGGDPPPEGRDAVKSQYGQALVSVLRNAELVPDRETNPLFVYQTPWTGFTNPAVPMLQNASEILLAKGPEIAPGLTEALQQLLGEGGSTVFKFRVLCSYERQLVAAVGANDATRLRAPLPVFYVPLEELQTGEIGKFATAADAQAKAWIAATEIVPAPGDAFVFDISVFANDDSQLTRPLVELSRLTVPMPSA